ncbi:hypothetical protein BH11GEM1_BH11GEM1_28920 [soil metagenome]
MKRLLPFAMVGLAPAALWGQVPGAAQGQRAPAPTATAQRTTTPPQLDGRLDDAAWTSATVVSDFTQRDPAEGQPASEQTEVRIVYDNEAIYIGARLHDRSPVTRRLGRRDVPITASDWFRVSFDSFLDRRNAFRFDVNPSGVRRDAIIVGNYFMGGGGGGGGGGGAGGAGGGAGGGGGGGGQQGGGGNQTFGGDGELAWEPVWDAATSVDEGGWTVEMRIPFSQLRFSTAEQLTWGLQFERIIDRTQELDLFSFTPKSSPGGVPTFGTLTGLSGVRPGQPLELIPYVLTKGQFAENGSNPFRGDREFAANAGLDARYRITSNLTLSASINPDFGQVEVDPAIINLTAFETRLEEKRPFFVEGANNFRFAGTSMGPGALTSLLYTRRIGRRPQLSLSGSVTEAPDNAGILGAAKITGRTAGGWSLGVLEAMTGAERGLFLDATGTRAEALVEPRTNYFVGRVNRELREGQTTIGGIFTALNRDVSDVRASSVLHDAAYAAGIDFNHEILNRVYSITGFLAGTNVQGAPAAIARTQRLSAHYYQRPDAGHVALDTTATSLGGVAGQIDFRKQSGLHWTGNLAASLSTPGYDINDMGFMQRADRTGLNGRVSYSERRPGPIFRGYNLSIFPQLAANLDGDVIEKGVRSFFMAQHVSYWRADVSASYNFERLDDRFTRGGPLALRPAGWGVELGIKSDPRKSITAGADLGLTRDDAGSETRNFGVSLDIRTSPQWNLSVGPNLALIKQDAQYVTSVADAMAISTFGRRYIFAALDQTELSLVTRVNYTFTPDLTLEVYTQPLVSNGKYTNLKSLAAPGTYSFTPYTGAVTSLNFTTRSLRGNAVLRWEYRPGSTFFLVWQQERLNPALIADFAVNDALRTLFDASASNTLVLKWTYYLNP